MLDRIIAHTPLGQEQLLFRSLDGIEALSTPFDFSIELLSTDARLDRKALLGQPLTLEIPTQGFLSAPRYLNGKITAIAVSSEEIGGTRYAVYSLHVQPDLWPMTKDRNFRIFQEQTVPQIVKTLLAEHNVQLEDQLTGDYRLWGYCVQYNESSFNFISRLMELEGIYYYFKHEMGKHTLVLGDAPHHHPPYPGYEMIPYHLTPSGGSTSEEGISQWTLSDRVTPGIYSLDDYDFRKPNAWLFQARQNPVSPTPGQIDVYDWPGRYTEHQQGEFYARVRQEAWQAEHQQIRGTATALGIAPGSTFTLYNAPHADDNREYLTLQANYHLKENRYASGDDQSSEHRIDFVVLPADVPWHPPQQATWPKTHGPQTARVVGPAGESIWTDKYGRIKVKFHWDRFGPKDDGSSCWVRVSSAWAGQGYGGVQIPRVNDEVVVDFINGDPDRPIVTGRVYNEASMPPWALPAAATQMGFMSRTKDGTADNANALRFEDKAGAEQVWIQAERNMDTQVKNDESHTIDNDHTHLVGGNQIKRVVLNQATGVKGDASALTGKTRSDAVVNAFTLGSGESLRLECGESVIELLANGQINITGTSFNITVKEDGEINTGGQLDLNQPGGAARTAAPGGGHQAAIQSAVDQLFPNAEASGTPGKPDNAAPRAAAAAPAKPAAAVTPFGNEVNELAAKSPTLSRDLDKLKAQGWGIKPGTMGKGTFVERQDQVIVIDSNHLHNPLETVQSLAHESGHALYTPKTDLTSRETYLNSMLRDEGAATLKNIEVQREIFANTGTDIGIAGNPENQAAYNEIYENLKSGTKTRQQAEESIGRIFGRGERTSNTGELYEDYYGGWYDKYVSKK
ncbi:type VI secretion system tip protein VgrG [Serratia marcescens]|nr:type VI secretion system tip protein VgrG [Serratia marcescens]